MKKYIITTTINNPTEAIHKFDEMHDWKLIVIGDKKTPVNYKLKNGIYLTPEDQENYDKDLSDAIGWNCIQRRNFGLIKAYELGADIVATIDDDNIPLDNWGNNLMISKEINLDYYLTDEIAFDPLSVTNHKNLWHRGFPLQLLSKRKYSISHDNLPTMSDHIKFVKTNNYLHWAIIYEDKIPIGTFYIQNNNSIGLNLLNQKIKIVFETLKYINSNFKPLEEIKSKIPSYFYINVPYENEDLKKILIDLENVPIQTSFKIT